MKADVFTMGQAKDAALLYEGVVCLVPDEVAVSDDVLQRKILQILAPSRLQKPYEEFLDTYFKNKALSSLRASLRDNSLSLGGIFSALMDEDLYRVFDDVGKIYNESKDAGLEALVGRRFLQKAEEPSAVVSLLDIDLIDTRSVEWDAILELRKDPDAFRRIRKLRNYMRSEMAGKSAEQIRDEILEQIEDYKVAARANGLLLKKGQIETVIPKLGPAQSLGIYAFFKGLSIFSWEAFAVAGMGYVFSLGEGKLKLDKTDLEFKTKYAQNPITHLITLDEIGALKPTVNSKPFQEDRERGITLFSLSWPPRA